MSNDHVVGRTKSAGYQIVVRRTFPISQENVSEFVASQAGLANWLGKSEHFDLKPGGKYTSSTGNGEFPIVKLHEQLRLTWKKSGWEKASTIQVRIIPKNDGKTTISFHQENLPDELARTEMKQHWEGVLERIGTQG